MNRRVLLVDDEPNVLRALQRELSREAFELEAYTSPRRALQHLREQRVAVIVSDQRMPEMEGIEFLSQAFYLQPTTVRIALTAHDDLACVAGAANEALVWRFLTKPWDDELLRQTLRAALRRYNDPGTVRHPKRPLRY